ncbi:MAG: ABC transporter ATP-binding protein [bacterium JZ-2024 1]
MHSERIVSYAKNHVPVISLQKIRKEFVLGSIRISVLNEIDCEIQKGEFVAIMGPSGSGKSTLMHIIGCLDVPTSGIYQLMGRRVDQLSDRELSRVRNQRIGFVFQAMNLLPQLSVIRNVELPLIYKGLSLKERWERAFNALQRVGLAHRLHHRSTEISGGEAQRTAIARALVTDPDIILADEPTGNLDSRTAGEIMALLQEIHRSGKTIVLVTHDRSIAEWSSRILHILDGRIVKEERL